MNIEMIKYPNEGDWMFCKECTLNTVGKKAVNEPTADWKKKILESEHSPIRTLWFAFRMEIPYYVSTHLVRHKIGVEHFVQSQRDDRTNDTVPRAEKGQGELVSHIIYINAQEFVNLAHMRLCNQTDKTTKSVVREMVKQAVKACPEFKSVLVPKCDYRNGKCTEFNPCGKWKRIDMAEEDDGK